MNKCQEEFLDEFLGKFLEEPHEEIMEEAQQAGMEKFSLETTERTFAGISKKTPREIAEEAIENSSEKCRGNLGTFHWKIVEKFHQKSFSNCSRNSF